VNVSRVIHTSAEHVDATSIATRLAVGPAASIELANGEDTPEGSGAVTPAETQDDEAEDDGGGKEDAATGPMKNTRLATETDGLLEVEQLEQLARDILGERGMFSCYGSTSWQTKMEGAESFGDRGGSAHIGALEPAWTIFSP
jgi:hypothetical protein